MGIEAQTSVKVASIFVNSILIVRRYHTTHSSCTESLFAHFERAIVRELAVDLSSLSLLHSNRC